MDGKRRKGVCQMGLHIVLFQPEIPANTGNIARTCVATNTTLHLIHPLGFSTDNKMLKRAGLDYWEHLSIYEYDSIESLYEKYERDTFYYIEDYGETYYTDVNFREIQTDIFFVFGNETSGLPKEKMKDGLHYCLRISMSANVRSLNLSNTAAIIIYEALRQLNFLNMK